MIMWSDSCVWRAKTNLTIFQIGKSANYQITHHSASPPGCAPCVSLAREGRGGDWYGMGMEDGEDGSLEGLVNKESWGSFRSMEQSRDCDRALASI